MKKKIITVIGKDRPGLIASISEVLFENDGNIENVRQTILQSQFAGIIVVSTPAALEDSDLQERLDNKLSGLNLSVNITDFEGEDANGTDLKSEPFIFTTVGPDKKGLVACFSRIIADFGVNISNLKAVFEGGIDPDKNIMMYEVEVPETVNQPEMFGKLRDKAEKLGLQISIQHRNIFQAINKI